MTSTQFGILMGLLIAIFVSGLSVVYATHTQRKLFIKLQKLQREEATMNIEWDKLLLEENTFSSTASIEKIATQQLGMIIPKTDQVIFIKYKTK